MIESGHPSKPLVVLLHGGGLGAWSWRRHLALLAPDFHCVAPELPGHGGSPSPPFAFDPAVERVRALIAGHSPGRPAHLVGLSLGGQLALAVAARHPGLVDRVVVTGANVAGIPFAGPALAIMRPFLGLKNHAGLARSTARRTGIPPDEMDEFLAATRALDYPSLRAVVLESGRFRAPDALRAFDHPVLILAGAKESGLILRSAATLAALLPRAQVRLVPGRGHTWPLVDPELFAAVVRAWILDGTMPRKLVPR